MVCSPALLAKRAFVTVVLATAAACEVVLTVWVTRESSEKELLKAFREVAKKAHPDKGGNTARFQKLLASKEAWESAVKNTKPAGRPASGAGTLGVSLSSGSQTNSKAVYRVRFHQLSRMSLP